MTSRPIVRRACAITVLAALVLSGCAEGTLATPSGAIPEPSSVSPDASPTMTAAPSPSATSEPPTPVPTTAPATRQLPIEDLLPVDPPDGFISNITCEGSIGASDPVAIVNLRAAAEGEPGPIVMRDYADVTEPRTVCTFGDYSIHSLIDARHVVVRGEGGTYAIVDLPEVRYHWFDMPEADSSYDQLLAVAPSLDAATWHRVVGGSLERQILVTDASGVHVLADLPQIETGRCGTPLDSAEGAYARTGDAFYVLDQPFAQYNVLLAARGTEVGLSVYPPESGWEGGSPLMAVWSPIAETLYYRIGDDVMRWSPGASPAAFMADTPWSHPTFTPDGRFLAYAVENGVYLVDMTANPAPRLIREKARNPVFVNDAQLWYEVDAEEGCVRELPEVRIYDLRDGSEAPSVVESVYAVWPATSSNSR